MPGRVARSHLLQFASWSRPPAGHPAPKFPAALHPIPPSLRILIMGA
jgi:hypothetical protein